MLHVEKFYFTKSSTCPSQKNAGNTVANDKTSAIPPVAFTCKKLNEVKTFQFVIFATICEFLHKKGILPKLGKFVYENIYQSAAQN